MQKQLLFNGEVKVGISEISDGNMRFFDGDESEVIMNQKKISDFIEIASKNAARVRTIYDNRKCFTEYFEITNENLSEYSIENSEMQIPVSDGLVTRLHDVGFLLPLADCLGIVVYDEENEALGLLHAGRQNIEEFGPRKFVEFFNEKFGSKAERLKIYFSPHAVNYSVYKFDGKLLSNVAKEQLIEAGVLLENILDSEIDTVSDEHFPSHSSGDKEFRFAIVSGRV